MFNSLIGRYFYNVFIVNKFDIVFSFYVKDNNIFPCYILLDFPITYINASVLCQTECACLHQIVNMVVFFVNCNENTYTKRRALMQNVQSCP